MSNNTGKDIYYNGRIYTGCPEIGMPDFLELPSYEVIGEHSFKDYDEVILGKDYELGKQYWGNGYWIPFEYYCGPLDVPEDKKRTIALPLPSTKVEDQEEGDKGMLQIIANLSPELKLEHDKCLSEGLKDERCKKCDRIFLAHHHFVNCVDKPCPMSNGKTFIDMLHEAISEAPAPLEEGKEAIIEYENWKKRHGILWCVNNAATPAEELYHLFKTKP